METPGGAQQTVRLVTWPFLQKQFIDTVVLEHQRGKGRTVIRILVMGSSSLCSVFCFFGWQQLGNHLGMGNKMQNE